MSDAASSPVPVLSATARPRRRASVKAYWRRLKRLGAGLADAVADVLGEARAARQLHPVVSAYRRR